MITHQSLKEIKSLPRKKEVFKRKAFLKKKEFFLKKVSPQNHKVFDKSQIKILECHNLVVSVGPSRSDLV